MSWDDKSAPTIIMGEPPAVGELRLIQYDGPDRRIVVTHADRRVWVTSEWVDTGRWCVEQLPTEMREVSTIDDVFTVMGSNRTVVYKLMKYDQVTDRYLAEWPD